MRRLFSIAATLALSLMGAAGVHADPVHYYPSYGPLYSGPLVNNLGSWRQVNRGSFGPGRMGGTYQPNYAIAGVNSAPIGKSETRRSGFRDTAANQKKREQDRLSTRLETVMKDNALVTGTVIRVGATAVSVSVEEGKKTRTERFGFDQVYFFRGGDLATAMSAPNVLQPGDRVLVPQPVNR